MKNEIIAKALRLYRKRRQLSVRDVCFLLEDRHMPVSPKTIYSWEAGTTQPDINTLLALCRIYEISDIMEAFGQEPVSPPLLPLSEEEEALVAGYRNHPEMHEAVRRLLC